MANFMVGVLCTLSLCIIVILIIDHYRLTGPKLIKAMCKVAITMSERTRQNLAYMFGNETQFHKHIVDGILIYSDASYKYNCIFLEDVIVLMRGSHFSKSSNTLVWSTGATDEKYCGLVPKDEALQLLKTVKKVKIDGSFLEEYGESFT